MGCSCCDFTGAFVVLVCGIWINVVDWGILEDYVAQARCSRSEHGLQPLCLDSDINAILEDEAYKTPPPGVDDDLEDDEEQCEAKEEEDARRAMTIAKRMLVRRKAWFMRREPMRRRPMTPLTKMGMNMIRRVKTPRSSDDEEHDSETLARFNEKAELGHVYLELGMEFVSLQQFKDAVKDYNISLGRQFIWLKNDKREQGQDAV
ncbi:hypothetical protein K1719_045740 [Acacia pycnantha]|nr:hypothetical protein K1719_045740 [Acacia pycnantha]